MVTNAENRFSDRVQNYIKYRPTYPQAVIDCLLNEKYIQPGATIADVGSGTGISAQFFLQNNFKVIAVEPNEAMRHAGEELLKEEIIKGNLISLNTNAEYTSIKD